MVTTTTLRAYLDDIDTMVQAGSTTKAISHCRHILQHYPQNVDTYRLLARALMDRGEREGVPDHLDEASEVFQRVLSVLPTDAQAHWGLGMIRLKKGQPSQALWHLERAHEQRPGDQNLLESLRQVQGQQSGGQAPGRSQLTRGMLARQYVSAQLYDQALIELRAALQETPDRLDLQVLLAQTLWETRHTVEAAEAATRILAHLPFCLAANQILACFWLAHDRPTDAQIFLDRIEVVDPHAAGHMLQPNSEVHDRFTLPRLDYDRQSMAAVSTETPEWMRDLESLGLSLDQTGEGDGSSAIVRPAEPELGIPPGAVMGGDQDFGVGDLFAGLDASWLGGDATLGPSDALPEVPDSEGFPDWFAELPGSTAAEIPAGLVPAWSDGVESPAEVSLPDLETLFGPGPVAGDGGLPEATDWLDGMGLGGEGDLEPEAATGLEWMLTATEAPEVLIPAFDAETEGSAAMEADWLTDAGLETVLVPDDALAEDLPEWARQAVDESEETPAVPDGSHRAGLAVEDLGLQPDAVPARNGAADWLMGADLDQRPGSSIDAQAEFDVPVWEQVPDRDLEPSWPTLDQDSPSGAGASASFAADTPSRVPPIAAGDDPGPDWMTQPENDFFSAHSDPMLPEYEAETVPDLAALRGMDSPHDVAAPEWLPDTGQLLDRTWTRRDVAPQASALDEWLGVLSVADQAGLEDVPMANDNSDDMDRQTPEEPDRLDLPQEIDWLSGTEVGSWMTEPSPADEPEAVPVHNVPSEESFADWISEAAPPDPAAETTTEDGVVSGLSAPTLPTESAFEEWQLFDAGPESEFAADADAVTDLGWLRSQATPSDDWLGSLSTDTDGSSHDAFQAPELMEPEISVEDILAAAMGAPRELEIAAEAGQGAGFGMDVDLGMDQQAIDDMLAFLPADVDAQLPGQMPGFVTEGDQFFTNEEAEFDAQDQEVGLPDAPGWELAAARAEDQAGRAFGEVPSESEFGDLRLDDQPESAASTWPNEVTWEQEVAVIQPVVSSDAAPVEIDDQVAPDETELPAQYGSAQVTGILQPDEAPDWMTAFTGEELPLESVTEDQSEAAVVSILAEPDPGWSEGEPGAELGPTDTLAELDDESLDNVVHAQGKLADADESELTDEPQDDGAMPDWLLAITRSEADKLDAGLFEEPEPIAYGDDTGVLQNDPEMDWLAGVSEADGVLPELDASGAAPTDAEDAPIFEMPAPHTAAEFLNEDYLEPALADFAYAEPALAEFAATDLAEPDAVEFEVFEAAPAVAEPEAGLLVAQPADLSHTSAVDMPAEDEQGSDDFSFDDIVPVWLRRPRESAIAEDPPIESQPEVRSQTPEWLRDVFEEDSELHPDG